MCVCVAGRVVPSEPTGRTGTPTAVRLAVLEGDPDAIVHQARRWSDLRDLKHFDRSFAQTNRLRTPGTAAPLATARRAGVRRFVAQSYASARYTADAAWARGSSRRA